MIRVGLIGAGGNTRARHIPGLRAVPGVEIVAVCNRRPASTAAVAREQIASGYLGALREVLVVHRGAALADAQAPLSWRQDAGLSGVNMLTLGILHETLLRWVAPPVRVLAQAHAFIPSRTDP